MFFGQHVVVTPASRTCLSFCSDAEDHLDCYHPTRTLHSDLMDKVAALSEILAQNPGDSFARYGLAMALASDGRNDDALREYAVTTDQNPDYVPAYQMSAQLLLKLGKSEEAKTRLEAGLAACARTGNTHAASEMGAMLEELN